MSNNINILGLNPMKNNFMGQDDAELYVDTHDMNNITQMTNKNTPQKKSPLVVSSLNQKTQELETYIQELNDTIEGLTLQLPTASPEERTQILKTIKSIEPIRDNLINTLNGMYSYYTQNVNSATNVLNQQKQAMEIVNAELENSKEKLAYIKEQKINKMRLIEINDYYGSEYAEYTKLVKYFIYALVPIIILSLLEKMQILSGLLVGICIIIIILASIYFIFPVVVSILSRDNMVYDQYRWNFDKSTAPKVELSAPSSSTKTNNKKKQPVCVGEECCTDGFKWNIETNKCEPLSFSMSNNTNSNIVNSLTNAMSPNWLGSNIINDDFIDGSKLFSGDEIIKPKRQIPPKNMCDQLKLSQCYDNNSPACSAWFSQNAEMIFNCKEKIPKKHMCNTNVPCDRSFGYCATQEGTPCDPGCCS